MNLCTQAVVEDGESRSPDRLPATRGRWMTRIGTESGALDTGHSRDVLFVCLAAGCGFDASVALASTQFSEGMSGAGGGSRRGSCEASERAVHAGSSRRWCSRCHLRLQPPNPLNTPKASRTRHRESNLCKHPSIREVDTDNFVRPLSRTPVRPNRLSCPLVLLNSNICNTAPPFPVTSSSSNSSRKIRARIRQTRTKL